MRSVFFSALVLSLLVSTGFALPTEPETVQVQAKLLQNNADLDVKRKRLYYQRRYRPAANTLDGEVSKLDKMRRAKKAFRRHRFIR